MADVLSSVQDTHGTLPHPERTDLDLFGMRACERGGGGVTYGGYFRTTLDSPLNFCGIISSWGD